jgi:hypothetical protein
MNGKVSVYDVGHCRPGSMARRLSFAVLVAWIAIFMMPAVNASEPAREAKAGADVADRLNHQQLALAAGPATRAAPAGTPTGAAAEDVGILFLRGDGGDPQQLRSDDRSNLVFIARRNGDGRAYRNGHEVEINPVLKESAGQIAMAQFSAPASAEVPLSRLPAAAQEALRQFQTNGATPHILYSHVTSRTDTGKVSEWRAAKILAMEASAQRDQADLVNLIRMAMRMFDLKSDACDDSLDSRCDQPGVREAFAQIKREEALQRTAARF